MKKTLKGILCLILVLGMIPAAVISAFAQGKGVAKNDSPNHTIGNAPNQYIPENIDIDGKRGDLGWEEYVNVDSVSGVWNVEAVNEEQKKFSYEYSIRRDHEMLYVIVDFGGKTVYDFDVYFSADDGATVTTVSFSAQNNKATVAGADVDKTVVSDGIVEIGYRLTAKDKYVEASTTYKYFIGAKYDESAILFYPAVYPTFVNEYKQPFDTSADWQAVWNSALVIDYNDMLDGAEYISEYVTIDGKFSEAYWSQLTNFHLGLDDNLNANDHHNGDYNLIDFDEVQYSDNHYYNGDKNTNSSANAKHLKLKADVRMDQYSIYGAALVQHATADKDFEFRLYVECEDKTLYKIVIHNDAKGTTAPSDDTSSFKVYKGATEITASKKTYTDGAIKAQNVGNIYSVEFRLDLKELGTLSGKSFKASVLAECKDCNTYRYIASTDNGNNATTAGSFSHTEYAWSFKYDEKKNDDLSNDIAIEGNIESATFKALLAHDRFLNGVKRPANYTTSGGIQSDCKQFAYTVHSDYEYLYCAALVDLKNASGNPLQWEANKYSFNLYVKKDWQTAEFSKGIKLYLADQDTVKFKLITDNGTTESAIDYTGNEIEAVIAPVKSLDTKNASDTRYAVEFKVPLSLLGISSVNDTTIVAMGTGGQTAAFYHAASVDDDLNATYGLAGPVPNFADINSGFKPATATYWWTSQSYAAMNPAIMADGIHTEHVWKDIKDGSLIDWTEVDYTNTTINPASGDSDALNALRNTSFRYKIVPGKENLYCAAEIDPIDFDNIQFALWIKAGDRPIRFALRNESGNELDAKLHAFWYKTAKSYDIQRGYDDTLYKPYVKYSLNKVGEKYYVELIINYKYFGDYNGSTWTAVNKNESFSFKYFVSLEEYVADGSKNEMLYPTPASGFKGNAAPYSNVASNWGSDLIAKAAEIEPLTHIAPETIKVDGNLNDPGWSEDQWIYVSALGNAIPQSGETGYVTNNNSTDFSFKYQLRHDDEYLYVGAVMYLPKEYGINASPNANTKGDTRPEFRIWITPKDTINEVGDGLLSFKYLYDIHAIEGSQKLILSQIEGIDALLPEQLNGLPTVETSDGTIKIPTAMSKDGYVTLKDDATANAKITYTDMVLRAAKNWAYWYPNGGNSHVVTKQQLIYDMTYGDTTFYGTNDILQENNHYGTNNGDDWYANVNNISYSIGNEHAYIGSGEGKKCGSENLNEKTAVVEFRIKKSEFDPNNTGFEYCFTATVQGWYDPALHDKDNVYNLDSKGNRTSIKSVDYALHYPARYCEPGSTYNYRGLYFPYWNWASALDFADIEEEAKLRNNTTPVVSLGAKVSNDYTKPDGTKSAHAIRFGARYEEKYIRYLAGMDDGNYWDVKDMGLCIAPKVIVDNLGNGELTLETPQVKAIPADNIVDWKSGGGSNYGTTTNFADYENFIFYVTIWDVPENQLNLDFSFRGYMTFYTGTYNAGDIVIGTREEMNAETFYGNTIVRNFNEVEFVSESLLTEEELPDHDGDFGVEDFEGRD